MHKPVPDQRPDIRAELNATHIAVIERLVVAGFLPAAFPLYANAIGIRRGAVAALLTPEPGGRLKLVGQPLPLIEGNLSVRLERKGRQVFVWKKQEIAATAELLEELARFAAELDHVLEGGS